MSYVGQAVFLYGAVPKWLKGPDLKPGRQGDLCVRSNRTSAAMNKNQWKGAETTLNHITVMGRLTQEPILRTTPSGSNVVSFTVAVERDFGQEKQTDFFDCVAWRQTGEFICKYFTKGQMIVVSGRMQSRKWQDKNGNNRTSWEINVDKAYFGESKRAPSAPNSSSAPLTQILPDPYTNFFPIDDEDDLPF